MLIHDSWGIFRISGRASCGWISDCLSGNYCIHKVFRRYVRVTSKTEKVSVC